ncbi:hypothetical protein [Krasilnikovia sp. MM14-A1259]|uniref:hypothetical protein n=1 Tax=Krasilnikovia sp. MM14-A1259 TaxID=3373539 RepID=UPI00382F5BF9
MDERLAIPRRFNGPPESANGGYACGLLAGRASAILGSDGITVTLHVPPPLDRDLQLERAGGRVLAWDDDRLIAVATPARPVIEEAGFVAAAEARAAESGYRGLAGHPFPTCFVCGTDRTDGLGLRPGQIDNDVRTACVWRPRREDVCPEAVWAALDCPGGWTADLVSAPMVLHRMTAVVTRLPDAGTECIVVGRPDERGPRTLRTTTALYDGGGAVLGRAVATWATYDGVREAG